MHDSTHFTVYLKLIKYCKSTKFLQANTKSVLDYAKHDVDLPRQHSGKESASSTRDSKDGGSIPGSERSPE